MGTFFKENKTFIGTIIAGLIISGSIYLSRPKPSITSNDSKIIDETPVDVQTEDLSFDLDISKLSYVLPEYDKICIPETRYDCSSEKGCIANKPVVFLLYNEDNNTVYRCDRSPCSAYEVYKNVSGLYTNLSPKTPRGYIIKISSNNEYVETVSLGLDFIIYRGKCIDKN